MATHNLTQARRIADEIVHIYNGKIVEAADTEDFFETRKVKYHVNLLTEN